MSSMNQQSETDSDADECTQSTPVTGLSGSFSVPGDKSISHRALMLGAIAEGDTTVSGLLEGDDVLRTAAAMRAIGADIEVDEVDGERLWRITGIGSAQSHDKPCDHAEQDVTPLNLYFGNAGTGARLAMGLVAGLGLAARFDGDASLRGRPMGRILDPLRQMGLEANDDNGNLPVTLSGSTRMQGISYTLPVASAQIKSAILLAGLQTHGTTKITEPERSRDHTEKMLQAFGARLEMTPEGDGQKISLTGPLKLTGTHVDVPGDPSSAAFLIVAALITPGSSVTLKNILLNPMRIGLITTLLEMGGDIELSNERIAGGEPVGEITIRYSKLRGVEVPAKRAPSMIDEYPILAVAASFAEGATIMTGIGEMRVKESDRIKATEAGLVANGVEVTSGPDWMKVIGSDRPKGGGLVATCHDHRIAMAFLVMGCAAQHPVRIDSAAMIDTSFPEFKDIMARFGAAISNG